MSDSEGDAAPVVCAIAHPLADAKLAKKVLKVVKKGAAAAGDPPLAAQWGSPHALPRAAASRAKCVRRGVKEVVKALRKQPSGCVASRAIKLLRLRSTPNALHRGSGRHGSFCVLAGNISPIDVITHVPVLCEDAGVPYIYVPSKEALGAAGGTKRPTSVMLVLLEPLKAPAAGADAGEREAFEAEYAKVHAKIKASAPVFSGK
jgi:H/ACA ribonucleoprotein complex subunit 2